MTLGTVDTLYARIMLPLMDEPEVGGGGGEEKPGAGSGGEKPGVEKPAESAAAGAKPGVGGQTKPTEDPRVAGILRDLQKERTTRQASETKLTELQTQLDLATKRIQALAGVNPSSQQDADEQAIKDALTKRFPVLGKLDEDKLDRLLGIVEKADSLEESNLRQWVNHASRMLDGVVAGVAKEIGGDLSERQRARLQTAYYHEAETNPEFLARHEAGDPKLVEEFVKQFVEDWFEPARRRVTQLEAGRQRRVPSARDRSVPSAGGKKIDFSDPKAVEDAMVASYRSHGGEFEG